MFMILNERNRDIGGFTVGRILPFRAKRMVGPFIFIDHMGPSIVGPPGHFDIGQHPHIGLSTLTYLLEGAIHHKDSLGSDQQITPGAVNWMTAGNGVVHTEITPEHLRGRDYTVHGYQIWVALPREKEDMAPSFHHIPKVSLPEWQQDGLTLTLVAGEVFSRSSPVPVHSDLFMMKLASGDRQGSLSCQGLFGEFGICPVTGAAFFRGQKAGPGEMLVVDTFDRENDAVVLEDNSLVMLFGGTPFPEKRYIEWNFVSSDKKKIEQAKERWRNREFEMIHGESSYVPLPGW